METAQLKLRIAGLDCPSCAATVERAVQQIDGMVRVDLNFTSATLSMEYLPNRVGLPEIHKVVDELGYGIEEPEPPAGLVIFHVEGMDCADELRVIEAALRRSGAVRNISANFVARTLDVAFDASATDPGRLRQVIRGAGFPAALEGEAAVETPWLVRHWKRLLVAVSGGSLAAAFVAASGETFKLWTLPALFTLGDEQIVTVATLLYALALVAGGFTIVRSAIKALLLRTFDMNLLMALAAVGAAVIWQWAEGAAAMFLFSLALLLESYTMGRARHAIEKLLSLAPAVAHVRRNGDLVDLAAQEVRAGEIVVVRPGETVPVDGLVLSGLTDINQAPVTGESRLVAKAPGDAVFAGSINQHGVVEVRSTKAPGDSTLARILHLVQEAQSTRAPSQQFVERFARWYTPVVILGAVLVALVPPLLLGYQWRPWFFQALVLLVIACPCALVISTPVSIISALAGLARRGILVKGGAHLENLGRARTFIFDKTGTLTTGRPAVTQVVALPGFREEDVLAVAAAVEAHSEHLLAEAVRRHVAKLGLPPVEGHNARALPGRGAAAMFQNEECYVGNLRLFEEMGVETKPVEALVRDLEAAGQTVVLVARGCDPLGAIALADEPRPEARGAIAHLRHLGARDIAMLTGDNEVTAQAIGRAVGLDHIHAALSPEDKLEKVMFLTKRDRFTAMVGDGVNDSPALAAATVGIAMGAAGTDVAIETADVALMTDRLDRVPEAVALGRRAMRVVRQNITVALAMKALFFGLAIAQVATLWMAVVADMGASMLVIANGLTLLQTGIDERSSEMRPSP